MEQNFIARYRIAISKVFFLSLICVALFSNQLLLENTVIKMASLALASGLVIIAVLGRLWCSLYLCGYKTNTLIDVGPFSMVRNPLYIFSFMGAIGIGIATTSVIITLMLFVFFLTVYPSVIANEEARLEATLGEEYRTYKERTPRLMPNIKLYNGVAQYTVNMRQVNAAFLDVVWFFVVLGLAQIIPTLHSAQVLPLSLW